MDFDEYQALAQRTANPELTKEEKQQNGFVGILGEIGEIVDLFKKHYYQGHELDPIRVAEELGDLAWYMTELCTGLGITLEDVARHNIKKLRLRYPNGFEVDKSINRTT